MNEEINLLRDRKVKKTTTFNNVMAVRIVSWVFLFIVSFSSITLFILIALSPLPSLQERKKDELKTLSLFSASIGKIYYTKDRISNISNLLQRRPTYTDAIGIINKNITPDMKVSSLRVEETRIFVTVTGDNLLTFDMFIKSLLGSNTQEKQYKKISLVSLLLDGETKKYNLTLELIR
jgi:hypothetical protein